MNDTAIIVAPFRTSFYLSFRNSKVQRWAARYAANGHYYALTPKLWRTLFGSEQLPQGTSGLISPNKTLYFGDENSAEHARRSLVERLTTEGVLK